MELSSPSPNQPLDYEGIARLPVGQITSDILDQVRAAGPERLAEYGERALVYGRLDVVAGLVGVARQLCRATNESPATVSDRDGTQLDPTSAFMGFYSRAAAELTSTFRPPQEEDTSHYHPESQ